MKMNAVYEFAKNLLLKVQGLSRTQAIIAAVSTVVAVGGVGTGGYFIYANNQEPQEVASTTVPETESEAGLDTESEELDDLVADTELLASISIEVTEETEAAESKALSLVGTSIEKDLKIKVQDQNSKLVSGQPFEVSVTSDKKGAKAETYQDKDKDGVIYIDKIDAGNYTVALKEVEGYEIKKGSITVTVKDKIAYEKVDVTAEIKKESEINASVEDTASNNVPVEGTLTDTVSLLESSVSTSTVAKADVDMSNFTNASASSEQNSKTLTKTVTTESTEKPDGGSTETESGSTETESGSTEPSESETQTPTETETQKPTPAETETQNPAPTPTETQMPTEGISTGDTTSTASVKQNRIARVGAATTANVIATVSMPKIITLYNCDNPASNSYTLTLAIGGDSTLIQSVTWASTNSGVVALSATSGTSVTLTKVGKGEANIGATITYFTDDKGTIGQTTLQSTVKVVGFTDTSTVLKDKSGNTLYVDEKAQKAATLKDYNSYEQFYTSPKYTGWQTIDGKVYYYNADHQPITGNQVIGGVTYTFAGDGSLAQSSGARGIDVSKWQGNIDWGAVASSGISFAIIRAGYRGASTGVLVEDPYFKRNIAGATRAGIKVGVYFFTQAISEAEAIEEASMTLSLVSGYNVAYPIFIDTESASNGRANGLDTGTRTAVVKAFCQTIANSGRRAGVYASKSWLNSKLNASSLSNYTIWVAQYNTSCTYSGKYDMWQYSSKGSVSGISGNVDMNISYLGY